ncbi:hypothetical protein P8452_16555 [Trifolium repens]|nr:hypothetical protein P8452_16555 [Trifolium repens]
MNDGFILVRKCELTYEALCNRRGYPVNKTDSSSFDVCSSPPSTSAFRRRRSSTRHRHCSSSTQVYCSWSKEVCVVLVLVQGVELSIVYGFVEIFGSDGTKDGTPEYETKDMSFHFSNSCTIAGEG